MASGLFGALFALGLVSGYLSYREGDPSNGNMVLGTCTVVGLVPAIIFGLMARKLAMQRNELGRLSLFLRQRVRASTVEVAQEFGWSEMEAEEKIIEAINEEHIMGHFDRGTRLFYVAGGQEHMAFVPKCRSCGADAGIWVTATEAAPCSFCGADLRESADRKLEEAEAMPQVASFSGAQQQAAPAAEGEAGDLPAVASFSGQQHQAGTAPQAQVTGESPPKPAPAAASMAPEGAPAIAAPPAYPVPTRTEMAQLPQRRKRTVKFAFLTMAPEAMVMVAALFIFLGVMSVAAGFWSGGEIYPSEAMLICGAIFYVPLFAVGGLMAYKAFTLDTYLDYLEDVADYVVTFRRVQIVVLARRMGMPEEKVRKLIDDILKYGLLEGQYSPDGSEFSVVLRPEDQQTVPDCPYCHARGINVQVIRGGSEECGYCGARIFFQEVRRT